MRDATHGRAHGFRSFRARAPGPWDLCPVRNVPLWIPTVRHCQLRHTARSPSISMRRKGTNEVFGEPRRTKNEGKARVCSTVPWCACCRSQCPRHSEPCATSFRAPAKQWIAAGTTTTSKAADPHQTNRSWCKNPPNRMRGARHSKDLSAR